jgi:hypothetical protein
MSTSTLYDCWCPEYGQDRNDALAVRAAYHEQAARDWAEHYDSESAGYLIASGNSATVHVAEHGNEESPIQQFVITAEPAVIYFATAVK